MTARVFLRQGKARPLFGRHPWVFERAIDRVDGSPKPADAVEVVSHTGEFIAHGFWNSYSQIRVRLYSWSADQPLNAAWIANRIDNAIAFRRDVLHRITPDSACRILFSESDGVSGLIIDRFADVITVQINALVLEQFEPVIYDVLQRSLTPKAIVRRTDSAIAELEGMKETNAVALGRISDDCVTFEESGVRFQADPLRGQKTGGYLDQIDNRMAVAQYAAGRNLLDVFCHAGGFGLVALARGNAGSVLGVDSSVDAIAFAKCNAAPFGSAAEYRQADASAAMTELARSDRTFGMVICDPPKFAYRAADIAGALRGYEYINRLAMSLVEPGGILVTCSCSGLVSPETFQSMLARASQRQGRELRLLELRGQPPDHPVSLFCPESAYLKCAILRVMD